MRRGRRCSASLSRSAGARRMMSTYKQTPESFQKVLDTFKKHRACAVLRTPTAEACPPAMQASIDGGFNIVEVRACRRTASLPSLL